MYVFDYEDYLDIFGIKKCRYALFCIRTSSHPLMIEKRSPSRNRQSADIVSTVQTILKMNIILFLFAHYMYL